MPRWKRLSPTANGELSFAAACTQDSWPGKQLTSCQDCQPTAEVSFFLAGQEKCTLDITPSRGERWVACRSEGGRVDGFTQPA